MNATSSIISLIISIVCAIACYKIAVTKNRGRVLWPILGFFFSIIALIIILILKPKPAVGAGYAA